MVEFDLCQKNLTIWRHNDVRLRHRVNQIMPPC